MTPNIQTPSPETTEARVKRLMGTPVHHPAPHRVDEPETPDDLDGDEGQTESLLGEVLAVLLPVPADLMASLIDLMHMQHGDDLQIEAKGQWLVFRG